MTDSTPHHDTLNHETTYAGDSSTKDTFQPNSNPGGGFPNSGGNNGGMFGDINEYVKLFGAGIDIGTPAVGSILDFLKGGQGGVFEGELFSWADGALAMGKISYHDFFEMAKKTGLKLDVSIVKETGADLANMAIFSNGAGQGR